MTPDNAVINDWRERRDMTLAIKERVEHQLRALNIEIMPGHDPDADQQQRLDYLQFELGQLQQAFDEAERNYLTNSSGSDQPERGQDNG